MTSAVGREVRGEESEAGEEEEEKKKKGLLENMG